jgi:hypothetical protein
VAGSLAAIALLAVACGSSAATTPSPTPTVSAKTLIKANWQKFFSGTTTATQKTALLQNGEQYAKMIQPLVSSPLAKELSAKVTSVTVTGKTATVKYNLLLAQQPILTGQTGQAVLQGGVWKVSDTSLDALLALMKSGLPSGLPSTSPSP